MKALVFITVVTLTAMVEAADSEQKPCTAHMCGREYDLSPLSSSSDYVIASHSGRNFTLNVCRSVVSDLWNPSVDRPEDVGGFFRGAHGDFSIGQVNSTIHVRDGQLVLYMLGGSSCPQSESMKASTAIQFICDTSVEEGMPKLLAQLPPEDDDACAFFIEWRTKYGCPVPDRYAYWKTAVMAIVILLALTLTFIALLALRKLLKRRRLVTDGPALPNGLSSHGSVGNGFIGGEGGPRSWPTAIAERARDVKRLLTGQDPWGHPNGYHAPLATDASAAPPEAATARTRRGSWFGGFRAPWSRTSRFTRANFSRLPRSAEEEAMLGGGPFSVHDDDDEGEHEAHRVNGVDAGVGAEESAAWGASAPEVARPRGMDSEGVIRL